MFEARMTKTSISLLVRVRDSGDQDGWARFVDLYAPLLYHWAKKCGLQASDAADLVQEVFSLLVQKLKEFEYDGKRSFRGWLRTVLMHKWQERHRKKKEAAWPEASGSALDPEVSDAVAMLAEAEYREHLVRRALDLMRAEFQPTTWQACWEYVVNGRSAAEVAELLDTTIDVVYAAKSRVMRRLRQELDGLLD